MRTFNDSLAADVTDVFQNVNEFAGSYTLSRGQQKTTEVPAIVVSREYDTPTREGVLTDVRSLDLDIATAAYAIGGEAVNPQTGDRLTDEDSGDVFEVLPLTGRQCFEPMSDGLVIRVHVKQVRRGS